MASHRLDAPEKTQVLLSPPDQVIGPTMEVPLRQPSLGTWPAGLALLWVGRL